MSKSIKNWFGQNLWAIFTAAFFLVVWGASVEFRVAMNTEFLKELKNTNMTLALIAERLKNNDDKYVLKTQLYQSAFKKEFNKGD